MTLNALLDILTSIKNDLYENGYDADEDEPEVEVEGWDDNAYDGVGVDGVRTLIDYSDKGRKVTVFIVKDR